MSGGNVTADVIMRIIGLGRSLLELPGEPLPEVADTLSQLKKSGRYVMVVFTKGEILDQKNKLRRSGLDQYFDDAVIVADKTKEEYRKLCTRFNADMGQMMMIGNSFKSDIAPVLQLGGFAAHIPFHVMWQYEVTKEYDHEHLFRLKHFGELTNILL